MPIDKLGQHLADYPRGREYSYMVHVTGSPYAWTDGKALWDAFPMNGYSDVTFIHGALASSDWTFDLVSDPQSPLDVGGGLAVHLIDEPSLRTRRFFAPEYTGGARTRLTAAAAVADTNITVGDNSGFADDDYIYVGLETMQVTDLPSGTSTDVARGVLGSTPARHPVMFGNEGVVGPRVQLSPRIHRGRYLSVYMGVVGEDGSVSVSVLPSIRPPEAFKVWAGRVSSVDFSSGEIKISCDSLTAALTKDEWPHPLPTGHLGDLQPRIYLADEDLFIKVNASDGTIDTPIVNNEVRRLGYRDTGGVFNALPTSDGFFTLGQLAGYISDTVNNLLYNNVPNTAIDDDFYNHFAFSTEQAGQGRMNLKGLNDTGLVVTLDHTLGAVAAINAASLLRELPWVMPPHSTLVIPFTTNGIFFNENATSIEYYPDAAHDPLFIEGCYSGIEAAMVGYARIYNGDNFELVSFTGEESAGEDGRRRLTGVKRGQGGTPARAWGDDGGGEQDGAGEKTTKISQVWMIDNGYQQSVEWFILPALLSTGDTTANTSYDVLGPRLGLGIPEEFVAHEEITDLILSLGLDKPRAFWVAESNKGKESLSDFLQANGLCLVAKRFNVSSSKSAARYPYNYFGISVTTIDPASRSSYADTVTDSDRTGGTTVELDFNERLIVNTVRVAPYWYFGKTVESLNDGFVFAHAEESIADYGAYKALEIKPTTLYALISAGGQSYTNNVDKYTGLATKIGLRWFGAYANGAYLLTLEAPHTGWRYLPGMPVRVTLTGVPTPDASSSMAGRAGRVMEVKHRHGNNPGATLVVRLSYDGGPYEMAPCMRAVAHSGGTTLTITRSYYSSSDSPLPVPNLETTNAFTTKDSHWFDTSTDNHGPSLDVWCWEIGDYAGGEQRVITSMVHGYPFSTATLSVALSAGLQTAATAGRLVITFAPYASATTLAQSYAYIGSSASPSLLDGTDEAPRWL